MLKFKFFVSAILLMCAFILKGNTLNWFLAASMVKPGKEIVNLYNKQDPSDKVNLSIGGSGELLSRIKISGSGGIYTPASNDFLKLAESDGVVISYKPLLIQEQVIALSKKINDKHPSFEDFCEGKYKIITGNPKVMALGETFLKFKAKLPDKFQKMFNSTPFGVNAVQIVNYIKNGNINAGYLFKSIAMTNHLPFISIPEKYQIPETSYLVILKNTENLNAAKKFEEFIFKNKSIFEKYGFDVIMSK